MYLVVQLERPAQDELMARLMVIQNAGPCLCTVCWTHNSLLQFIFKFSKGSVYPGEIKLNLIPLNRAHSLKLSKFYKQFIMYYFEKNVSLVLLRQKRLLSLGQKDLFPVLRGQKGFISCQWQGPLKNNFIFWRLP